MKNLGILLKRQREQKNLSMRDVERRSKELHPDDRKRWISHTHLRKLEEAQYQAPSPFRLKTIAAIYHIDYLKLLILADYLEGEPPELTETDRSGQSTTYDSGDSPQEEDMAARIRYHLKRHGIHAEYFFKAILGLGRESLSLVNRLVTVMRIHEGEIKKQAELQGK